MSWLDTAVPIRMKRVALVAADEALRDVLVRVADSAAVEIGPAAGEAVAGDATGGGAGTSGEAARRLQGYGHPVPAAALSPSRPDLDALERAGRYDLLAGEAQLEAYAGAAFRRSGASALAGWIPARRLAALAASVAEVGGAVVPLPYPPGVQPPTQVAGRPLRRSVSSLVQTYGTVPYADIAPVWLAWAGYVLMFGMMFGDAGEGILLIGVAAALRAGWPGWARQFRRAWPFVGGAGVAATIFGLLYGEFFGPPAWCRRYGSTRWITRSRCSWWRRASGRSCSRAPTRSAWSTGGGRAAGRPRCTRRRAWLGSWCTWVRESWSAGGTSTKTRCSPRAGSSPWPGWPWPRSASWPRRAAAARAWLQASAEVFDLVVRLGSNVVSFTRLAAFGLTHAALGLLVWEGTLALWRHGGLFTVAAVILFVAGTALAFGLEGLVAAIQALRLEYYELFSRVFVAQGRPFRPWHVPMANG